MSNAQLLIDARDAHLRPRGNATGPITATDHRSFADAVIEVVENLDNKPSGDDAFLLATGSGAPDPALGRTDTVVLNTTTGDIWQKLADGSWDLKYTFPTSGGAGGPFTIDGITEFRDRFAASETGTAAQFFAKLLVKEVFPSYTAPTVGVTSTQTGVVKRGTTVAPTIGTVFTQNDAGALSSYQLQRGATVVASDTTAPIEHPSVTDSYVIEEETLTYKVTFAYGQGPLKQSSQNNPAPGRIEAGSVTAQFQLIGIMPWYYGVSDTDTTPAIYAGTEVVAASTGPLTVPGFGSGSKWLWFAVPRNADGSRTKEFTTWYRTALDNGSIGGSGNLFRSPVVVSVTSTGLAANWTRDYDLYFSNYATGAAVATTLN